MASNSLFSLEDQQLAPKIIRTHAQVMGETDMKPLLSVVEDIINQAKALLQHDKTIEAQTQSQDLDGSGRRALDGIVASAAHIALESPINYTSYMITWKCGGGEHEDSVAMELLQSVLSKYPWDAKVVIAYAAFAVAYGEFWLLQNPQSSRVAGKMAPLMGFSDRTLDMEVQKAGLQLLNLSMDLTKCVIELQGIPSKYTTLIPSDIPLTVYRIISSLVVCASLLTDASWNYRVSSIEAKQKITTLHKMLQPVLPKLEEQVQKCKSKKDEEGRYMEFEKTVVSAIHIDNMKILNAFFCEKIHKRLLYDGSRKINERLDVLKRKHVLLLISDLEYPPEELRILRLIYNSHSMRRDYEILWLPVVDPAPELSQFQQDSKFYNLRNDMPWYSVEHPSAIEPVFIRFVREVLGFKHLPMLILLDPVGRFATKDAFPMMWIWGESAFPFTGDRKRALLADSKWSIQLVAEAVDPRISEWIRGNKVVCLYGGEDADWVRKFIHSVRTVAQALKVTMEVLYVGKSNPKEKVRLCHQVITADKLSHVFAPEPDYYDFVWFFWVRLVSLWNCKKEMGTEDDDMMINIKHLLSYDSNDKGWALFSRGSDEITMARGDNVLPVLDSYNTWEKEVDQPEKFVGVLHKFFEDNKGDPNHCNRLILPSIAGVPETILCPDCNKEMERYIMYRCCND